MADIIDDAQRAEAAWLASARARRARPPEEPQERDHMGRIICAECGEPIAPARLSSVPTAARCAGCQEDTDALRWRFERA